MEEDDAFIPMQQPTSSNGSTALDLPYNLGFMVIFTIIGTIGGFLFGYDSGIIAGA